MELIFERGRPGRGSQILPPLDVPAAPIPEQFRRESAPRLPEIGESDLSRHYQALARRAFGVCCSLLPPLEEYSTSFLFISLRISFLRFLVKVY